MWIFIVRLLILSWNLIDMSKVTYINPEFQEMIAFVPEHIGREVDLSFDIAKRIYDILKRKGWSQADFAKAAGKKEAEISKWLSGQHNFTIRTIAFIETVLGEGIVSVRKYRTSSVESKNAEIKGNTSYTRTKRHSSYAPGLLNDEGGGRYSSKKKK